MVEPTLENTPLEVLLGILQQRIELDKEVMFQYTQLRKEVRLVDGQTSVAPVLMRYQRGCQQVGEHSNSPTHCSGRVPRESRARPGVPTLSCLSLPCQPGFCRLTWNFSLRARNSEEFHSSCEIKKSQSVLSPVGGIFPDKNCSVLKFNSTAKNTFQPSRPMRDTAPACLPRQP